MESPGSTLEGEMPVNKGIGVKLKGLIADVPKAPEILIGPNTASSATVTSTD